MNHYEADQNLPDLDVISEAAIRYIAQKREVEQLKARLDLLESHNRFLSAELHYYDSIVYCAPDFRVALPGTDIRTAAALDPKRVGDMVRELATTKSELQKCHAAILDLGDTIYGRQPWREVTAAMDAALHLLPKTP